MICDFCKKEVENEKDLWIILYEDNTTKKICGKCLEGLSKGDFLGSSCPSCG